MNKKLSYISALGFITSLLLFTSCVGDIFDWINPEIKLTASTQPPTKGETRAANNIQSTNFEEGEKINIYLSASDDSPMGHVLYTTGPVVGGKNELIPDMQPYFPGGSVTVSAYALYPSSVTSSTDIFTVAEDQTDDDDYKSSDLMYASFSNIGQQKEPINLVFSHKLAKLTINTTAASGISIEGIYLKNLNRSIGINPVTGVLDMSSQSNPGNIVLDNGGSALIPPQSASGDFLVILTDVGEATYSLPQSKNFESGKNYTINISVGYQNIGTTASITDWSKDGGTATVDVKNYDTMVIENIEDQTYTGSALTPEPVVRFGASFLTKGTDYTLDYFTNVNAGTGTVLAIGKGNYAGATASKSFTIKKAQGTLTFATSPKVEKTYGDAAFTNAVTKVGDGSVSWSSNNNSVGSVSSTGQVTVGNVGTATITATLSEGANYLGTTQSYLLQVNAKGASAFTVTLSPSEYTYDGTARTPTVTVKFGNTTLNSSTDYSVSYSNNVNAGTATVTVEGKGNFTGTTTKNFTIHKAPGALQFASAEITKRYGDAKFINAATATAGNGAITYSTNNTTAGSINSSTGEVTVGTPATATITATMAESTNHTSATATYKLTVLGKLATNLSVTLSQTTYTYDGNAKQPGVTVKDGNTTLTNGTHYTVSYSSNTNAGTATVTVTGKGLYAGTKELPFTINPTESQISYATTTVNKTNNDDAFTNTLTLTKGDGAVTYTSGNTTVATVNSSTGQVTPKSAGSATITATRAATTNYKSTTATYTVKVTPASWTFNYTAAVQTFTTPKKGNYKLEVWGAHGGNCTGTESNNNTCSAGGGNGGYAYGHKQANASTTWYICTGGEGQWATAKGQSARPGGYNGGGNGGAPSDANYVGSGGGGGATHISTVSGVLSNTSVWNAVLIVAGGGGGGAGWPWGGHGGGDSGNAGNKESQQSHAAPSGGTQNSGYAKGQGQHGIQTTSQGDATCEGTGGGGGGYWGGYASTYNTGTHTIMGGGGGSGYTGGVSTPKGMTTGARSGGSSYGSGHGYAIITLVTRD